MNRSADTVQVPGEAPEAPIDWKSSPIDRAGWITLAVTFVVGVGVLTVLGLAILEWWEPSAAGRADVRLSRWFEDARTADLTEWGHAGSALSDTITKVLLGIVLIPVFLWLFRRWNEYAFVIVALVVETCAFGLASRLVGRDRPPVEQLDGAPTGSFPSGHVAASVVFYGAIAVLIWVRAEGRGLRIVAAMVAIVPPLIVATSRLYLGMHYLTDVTAGATWGVAVLYVMWRVVDVRPPGEQPPAEQPEQSTTE